MKPWLIDPQGIRRGQVEALSGDAVLRDAGLGTYQISAVLTERTAAVGPGWRLLIPGVTSGPIRSISTDVTQNFVKVTWTGVSELACLAHRVTLPDPLRAPDAQRTDYYRATGRAETAIRSLVDLNAGPSAREDRRTQFLTLPPSKAQGNVVTVRTRLKNLLDECRHLAREGGVTFDATWVGDRIEFVVRTPKDLSRQVRFGGKKGGLKNASWSLSAPTTTAVVVGGQGEGASRTLKEYIRTSTWGRIETFKDQRDTDKAEDLDKSGEKQLDDGAESATANFSLAEVPGLTYGVDYQLGDIVSVHLGNSTLAKPVREVHLTWTPTGRNAEISVGDHDQADNKQPAWVSEVKSLKARTTELEVI
ncbi:Gp37-like protein [Devriesea agamarum]|uniref:Gp37-like protein n=1 Tax=Devriesea agamarum TaxID=472569 RepID=UPI00071CFA5F|nr:siphovirus ReqiPepy6 Gp37-like family protein [Devriesea agamarum]